MRFNWNAKLYWKYNWWKYVLPPVGIFSVLAWLNINHTGSLDIGMALFALLFASIPFLVLPACIRWQKASFVEISPQRIRFYHRVSDGFNINPEISLVPTQADYVHKSYTYLCCNPRISRTSTGFLIEGNVVKSEYRVKYCKDRRRDTTIGSFIIPYWYVDNEGRSIKQLRF